MNIDTNTIFSMTEANQNFSMVARTVDQYGTAIIHAMKYGYLMMLKQMKLHLMKMFLTFPKSY